jgi:hypothetical protein
MDVASWLRSLGLEKYEALFRENEIDVDVLPELTELDLEKLGADVAVRSAPHLSRRTWPDAVRAWTRRFARSHFRLSEVRRRDRSQARA